MMEAGNRTVQETPLQITPARSCQNSKDCADRQSSAGLQQESSSCPAAPLPSLLFLPLLFLPARLQLPLFPGALPALPLYFRLSSSVFLHTFPPLRIPRHIQSFSLILVIAESRRKFLSFFLTSIHKFLIIFPCNLSGESL